jgi:hypothetical protein
MDIHTIAFWGLVIVTAGVSYRWGSMVGLIVFILVLMAGSIFISRWSLRAGTAEPSVNLAPHLADAGSVPMAGRAGEIDWKPSRRPPAPDRAFFPVGGPQHFLQRNLPPG